MKTSQSIIYLMMSTLLLGIIVIPQSVHASKIEVPKLMKECKGPNYVVKWTHRSNENGYKVEAEIISPRHHSLGKVNYVDREEVVTSHPYFNWPTEPNTVVKVKLEYRVIFDGVENWFPARPTACMVPK